MPGGGAGWAFLRRRDQQLYLRSGSYSVFGSGILASASGPVAIHNPPAVWSVSITGKTKPFSWLELNGAFALYKALQAGTQAKVFFDNTECIPITKRLSFDLHFYDPPDISQVGVLSIHYSKFCSGLGYSF
jgi:hypothetical protein